MSDKMFDILGMDAAGGCVIKNVQQLSYSIMSNAKISENAVLNSSSNVISFQSVKIKFQLIEPDNAEDQGYKRAFLVTVKGSFDDLEPVREHILSHLHNQKLQPIYVLKDEISEEIACKLYPRLYRIENALRGYLIKFMSTRIGPKWWEATAESDMKNKIQQRTNNERVFKQFVDNKAYLIDFADLGKMIYEQSSGFTSKSDVIKRILECEEDVEALKKLKSELQSNYQKFFKEHFKDKRFQEKWETFQHIRHKIAHSNLFTIADLKEGESLTSEILSIIEEALKEISKIEIEETEKEAIKASFISKGLAFEVIKKDEFLRQLADAQSYFAASNGFVGLAHFVKNHLGSQGYDWKASYTMANDLHEQGVVDLYPVDNPEGDYPVKAIKLHTQQAVAADAQAPGFTLSNQKQG